MKGKQQYQILREEYDISYQNYGQVETQPAHSEVIVAVSVRFGTFTLVKQHPLTEGRIARSTCG